ncbi:MAG TPA: tripartite tricarboxylate transporter TctB family protein [Candidatus Binatia bacterium]|nr:tripartite tricarboxylate transporter TctB family protein [Candidatus Binatia bacterium]
MRRAEVITASVLILLGGLVILDAMRLGIGWGTDGPKSGFFPFWLALIMVLACAITLAQQITYALERAFVEPEKLRPVLKVLWPAVFAVALMQWLGLYVASALYMGFYMRWVGHHSWWTVFLLSLGIPVVTFLIFEKWFFVPMPKGPLEAWLGY